MNEPGDWFRFCRPYLEELNPRPGLDLEAYVRDMVSRAVSFNADTLVMMADEGGHPLYPSALAPESDHLHGADLLAMVEAACRAAGLRFGAGFLGVHCNSWAAAEHPEWLMRDRAQAPVPFHAAHLLCPNSPYGRFLAAYVGEVLARSRVDWLYIEGGYFRPGCCHCAYCREQFRETFGHELPPEGDSREVLRFRRDSITRMHARIRRAARELSPSTVVVATTYHDWYDTTDFPRFRLQADVVAREDQWGHEPGPALPTLHEPGIGMARLRALSRAPVVGTWWASRNVDLDYAPRSPAHARLTFMETLAHGATVQPHVQTGFEVDAALQPVLAELFDVVRRARPFLRESAPLPFIGILDGPGACGCALACIEAHLPWSFVTPEDLAEGTLGGHRAILVPEVRELADPAVEGLERFARAGGGLVVMGRAADLDGDGVPRPRNPLRALAGVDDYGTETPVRLPGPAITYPVYWRVESGDPAWDALRGRLLSWHGPYLELEPGPGTTVVGRVEDIDWSRAHKAHMVEGAYPGARLGPMAVTRPVGEGRVLLFAADIARAAAPEAPADADAAPLIAAAARWAAGAPSPLVTSAPPSVEACCWRGGAGVAVFLVNQAASQAGPRSVVRWVAPAPGFSLDLQGVRARAVTGVTGRPLRWENRGSGLHLEVDGLEAYEVLLVDEA